MNDDQFVTIMNKLDELHGDFREHKGSMEAKVENLESAQKIHTIYSVCVLPVVAGLHFVAKHLGW